MGARLAGAAGGLSGTQEMMPSSNSTTRSAPPRAARIAGDGHLRLGLIASLSHGVVRVVMADLLAQHVGVDLDITEIERCELLMLLSHRRMDAMIASRVSPVEQGDSS